MSVWTWHVVYVRMDFLWFCPVSWHYHKIYQWVDWLGANEWVYVCMHEALQWTGIPSSVYSFLRQCSWDSLSSNSLWQIYSCVSTGKWVHNSSSFTVKEPKIIKLTGYNFYLNEGKGKMQATSCEQANRKFGGQHWREVSMYMYRPVISWTLPED